MTISMNAGSLTEDEAAMQAEKYWTTLVHKARALKLSIPIDCLYVSVNEQQMYHYKRGKLHRTYQVSTAKMGVNSREGSYGTPPGMHRVLEKFGDGQPVGMIFKARAPIGKLYSNTDKTQASKDLVTTRVFWLDGLEKGVNKGGQVDSHRRYIYIHGTNNEAEIGNPVSHGCVRMLNEDVALLYEEFRKGGLVLIAS